MYRLHYYVTLSQRLFPFRTFISKLPDQGEKVKAFRDRILKELEHKNEVETAANLLSRLNLASEGKAAMNELEWTGKYNKTGNATEVIELDSDDDEDPVKILAQVSFVQHLRYITSYIICSNTLCSLFNSRQGLVFTRRKLYIYHLKRV